MYTIEKRKWSKLKKRLPNNYRVEAQKILLEQGFEYKLHDISDTIRGRLKNLEKVEIILKAIMLVVELEEKKQDRIYHLL